MANVSHRTSDGRRKRAVVHLSTVHGASDVRFFHKECVSLARAGYDVAVVAPCDVDGVDRDVRIVAIKRETWRPRRMICGAFRALRAALRQRADLYHFHDAELIPVGLLLRLLGKRVVYDVHESVPEDILTKGYIPGPLRGVTSRLVRITQNVAAYCLDGIVAATPHIARSFPRGKTVTVQNFPLLEEMAGVKPPPYAERAARVAYAGGIFPARKLDEVVTAMSLLPDSLDARLCLMGEIRPAALEAQLRGSAGWKHVDFLGWINRHEVANMLAGSRVGIVTSVPSQNALHSQPTKLFEYMSAGLPVVASDIPRWREILEDVGCGLLVDPCGPQAIARAIEWILTHPKEAEQMGQRGRAAIAERFNWQRECRVLLQFYDRLFHEPDHRRRSTTPVHQDGDSERSASRAA